MRLGSLESVRPVEENSDSREALKLKHAIALRDQTWESDAEM